MKVLLVGSGFSNSIGQSLGINVPVTSKILEVGQEMEELKDPFPNLWIFYDNLKRQWGEGFTHDIERIYDMVAIAENAHEHIWLNKTPYEAGILRQEIESFIGLFFLRIIKNGTENKIKEAVIEKLTPLKPLSLIISLNWDHLIPLALQDNHSRRQIFEVDVMNFWGFVPDWLKNGDVFERHPEWQQKIQRPGDSQYLKLHGCVTWFSCQNKNHVVQIDPHTMSQYLDFNDSERDKKFRCPEDYSKLDFLLLPPSSEKDYSIPPFPELWKRALIGISEADEIYVFGCNFRGADFRLYDLFLKARLMRGKSPKVFIKEKDPDSFKEVKEKLQKLGYSNCTNDFPPQLTDQTPSA